MKLRRIYQKIRHIIQWLPTIWNDYDFDYGYLYKLIYVKLENMERHIKSVNCCVGYTTKELRRITVAKNLAMRIYEDDYDEKVVKDWKGNVTIASPQTYDIELLGKYLLKYSRSWWD